ncbi:MAG: hypothetical protein QNK20_06910, partial [Aureibaculum sp.]|nr:hypothetical protein [Aureibaculum sp.]
MKLTNRQQEIISIITSQNKVAISRIKELLGDDVSIPTLNRDMAKLVDGNYLQKIGAGRTTAYIISPYYKLFVPVKSDNYFNLDPDARGASTKFNYGLIESLQTIAIFTKEEQNILENLKQVYQANIANLSSTLYQKELERLTIELSWKSSQIEGNTYSLLETEILFKEKQEADNKTKEEATMLLNHK